MSSEGPPQATSTHSMPRRTLPRASSSVLPCSVVTMRASSSKCSSSSALKRNIARARTTGGVSLQPGNACRAAVTAASRSRPVESGTLAITLPSAGLWTSSQSDAVDWTQRPPMKFCSRGTSAPVCVWSGPRATSVGSGMWHLVTPKAGL